LSFFARPTPLNSAKTHDWLPLMDDRVDLRKTHLVRAVGVCPNVPEKKWLGVDQTKLGDAVYEGSV
jgi:hypothetical protein